MQHARFVSLFSQRPHDVRADKSGSAGDKCFHTISPALIEDSGYYSIAKIAWLKATGGSEEGCPDYRAVTEQSRLSYIIHVEHHILNFLPVLKFYFSRYNYQPTAEPLFVCCNFDEFACV